MGGAAASLVPGLSLVARLVGFGLCLGFIGVRVSLHIGIVGGDFGRPCRGLDRVGRGCGVGFVGGWRKLAPQRRVRAGPAGAAW